VGLPLVMLVEDEVGLLELFGTMLGHLNCRILAADGGERAMQLLDEETPDVLILDLAMPEVDGFDVLSYARSIRRLDAMKVMIITARPNLIADIEPLGIDCWVTKPILPDDFVNVVQSLLS
jgi:DNA-binding response OmpR family regulator